APLLQPHRTGWGRDPDYPTVPGRRGRAAGQRLLAAGGEHPFPPAARAVRALR
ncbi:MAG: hypothetical protein AVDCRST_MAG05-3468, partial [uncultured Rubrobacteraceae bacterium]